MTNLPIITSPPGFQVMAAKVVSGKCETRLTPIIGWSCGFTPHDSDASADDPFFLFSFPVVPECGQREDEDKLTHFILWPDGRVSDGGKKIFANIGEAENYLVIMWHAKNPTPKRRSKVNAAQ